MKNSSMIVVILLVLVVGGVGVYAMMGRDASMTKLEETEKTGVMVTKDDQAEMVKDDDAGMQKGEPAVADSNETMMQKEGAYAPFSAEVLADSKNSKRVLFFYANWCPTCKPADASFTQNLTQIPADVTVIRVNYNDTETDQAEKDLAKKYGITYQHTFVQIDANGNEVTKWNGGGIDELLSNLQ
ncbi:thioredoxin family protein [Candidatus Woesebacteria bacterium]|nr:thioredoxin family protein [Candidatus Woesebacteria bacterium]